MSDTESPEMERLTSRLTHLEELLMHFQRTLDDLDQVTQQLQVRLDTLEARQASLSNQMERQSSAGAEPRRLEDERPPHY